jgi:hypothetical protein
VKEEEIMSEETKFMRRFQTFGKHGDALRKYGDGNTILKSSLKQPHRMHLTYKVGDGILVFEISPSAGVILDIGYVIDGNTHWVEEFNPYTGDIKMFGPNEKMEKINKTSNKPDARDGL